MKVSINKQVEPAFTPVSVTITLETVREAALFRALVGNPDDMGRAMVGGFGSYGTNIGRMLRDAGITASEATDFVRDIRSNSPVDYGIYAEAIRAHERARR